MAEPFSKTDVHAFKTAAILENIIQRGNGVVGNIADKIRHHRRLAGGAAAAAAASPLVYDRTIDLGQHLYGIANKSMGVNRAITDADPNSEEAKRRRRALSYAQRRANLITSRLMNQNENLNMTP